MPKPVCAPIYKDLILSTKICRPLNTPLIITTVKLSDWTNPVKLVKNDPKSVTVTKSIKKYITCFETIGDKLTRHPYIAAHLKEVAKYLKEDETQKAYTILFNTEKNITPNASDEGLKRKLNQMTLLISQAEVLTESQKRLRTLKQQIDTGESSGSGQHEVSARVGLSDVNDIIFDDEKAIHQHYVKDKKLSPSELKTMACGLSSILDINSDDKPGSQRLLFNDETWDLLSNKYSKLQFPVPLLPSNIKYTWRLVSMFCSKDHVTSTARKHLYKLLAGDIPSNEERSLNVLLELLYLIESKFYLLDERNHSNVYERDFAYQLWLPLFDKLFFINSNVVRIKVGETRLAGATTSKEELYPGVSGVSGVVGFKVDVRILLDFKKEEFDIASGKACLHDANDKKVKSDGFKLMREGKEMLKSMERVFYDEDVPCSVWTVQVAGLKASFSTIHPTKHNYYVKVHQFDCFFLTSYSMLGDPSTTSFLEKLFLFRTSVEGMANKLERKLSVPPKLPESSPSPIERQTWFTPPNKDRRISRVPKYTTIDSYFESCDDESGDSEEECEIPDEYGFIVKGN